MIVARFAFTAAILIAAAACTTSQKAIAEAGLDNVRSGNDTIASALIAATCGMTVGAYYRLEDELDRRGVALLCGGPSAPPLTADDFVLIDRAATLLTPSRPR